MNKIFIDEKGYYALEQWAAENKQYVLIDTSYFSRCELHFKGSSLVAFATAKKDGARIDIKDRKGLIIKAKIIRTPNGKNDYGVFYDILKPELSEWAEAIVNLASRTYIDTNAFLFFGNVVDEKSIRAFSKNDKQDKVVIFREFEGKCYAVPTTRHRSPEGVFEVRGHFRKYQSGKVIWIDSYLKGLEK